MKQFTKVVALIAFVFATSSTIQAQDSKVAHIASQALVEAMPAYKTAVAELEKLQQSYDADISSMAAELQKTSERYNREAELQTDEENGRRYTEVQDTRQNIVKYQQNATKNLQQKEQELLKPIIEQARLVIQEVAREGGYQYVLDSTVGLGVIMADGYNLMDDAKKKLGI